MTAVRPPMVLVPQKLIDQLHQVELDLTAAENPHLAEDRQILHMVLMLVDDRPHMSRADMLVALEQGELTNEDTINLFQCMICDGDAWHMAAWVQHIAEEMIEVGHCYRPREVR